MVEKKDETQIDPQFFLPPNVYDIRYTDKDDVSTGEATAVEYVDGAPSDGTAVDYVADSPVLQTGMLPIPDGLTVVSQTVKAAAGGGYLVDIVVDIPDLPGVETFDVAVTKA